MELIHHRQEQGREGRGNIPDRGNHIARLRPREIAARFKYRLDHLPIAFVSQTFCLA